jgi:hypothetical protein
MLTTIKNNQLTFTDGRFYPDTDGVYYPSVTTVLEAFPKPYALLQWMKEVGAKSDEVRDAAGRRGSTVHTLTESYDKGEQVDLLGDHGQPMYSLEEWGLFERYVEFSTRFNPVHSMIEQQLVCGELGFGGTIDRVCEVEGKKILLDIKTSNGIYDSYWLQLAAYREGLYINSGIEVDAVGILWLNAKTRTIGKKGDVQGVGWQLLQKDDTRKDWELFRAVHKIWLSVNEGAKPKEFSYTLSHKKCS